MPTPPSVSSPGRRSSKANPIHDGNLTTADPLNINSSFHFTRRVRRACIELPPAPDPRVQPITLAKCEWVTSTPPRQKPMNECRLATFVPSIHAKSAHIITQGSRLALPSPRAGIIANVIQKAPNLPCLHKCQHARIATCN